VDGSRPAPPQLQGAGGGGLAFHAQLFARTVSQSAQPTRKKRPQKLSHPRGAQQTQVTTLPPGRQTVLPGDAFLGQQQAHAQLMPHEEAVPNLGVLAVCAAEQEAHFPLFYSGKLHLPHEAAIDALECNPLAQ